MSQHRNQHENGSTTAPPDHGADEPIFAEHPETIPAEASPEATMDAADSIEPHADHIHGEDDAVQPGTDYAEAVEEPAAAPAFVAAPPRRKKSGVGIFTGLLATLGLVGAGGSVLAIKFKDKDPRLAAVADVIERAVDDPSAAISSLTGQARGALGLSKSETAANDRPTATETPAAPEVLPDAVIPTPPAKSVEPAPPPKSVEAPPRPTESRPAAEARPGAPERRVEAPEVAAARAPAATPSDLADQIGGLEGRIDELGEELKSLRGKLDAVRAEPPAAASTPLSAAPDARLDELAEEVKTLRARLEAPKAQTRVEPEAADSVKPGKGADARNAAALIALADAAARRLDHGRPYAAEYKALSALGVDAATLAPLTAFAETGAPGAAQLLRDFEPAARKLRVLDAQKPAGSLTDQWLSGAEKFLKAKPLKPSLTTSGEVVDAIETALAHGDIAAASEAFEHFSDAAKAEAKTFGDRLTARRDAERALEQVLSSAAAELSAGRK